ncbi:MAG: hypothetical protein R2912_02580 [Eubacteriales bacterium]
MLAAKAPETLLLLLEEQEKRIREEQDTPRQKRAVEPCARPSARGRCSIESIADMERMMEEAKKLKKLHWAMIWIAAPMTVVEWTTILLGSSRESGGRSRLVCCW